MRPALHEALDGAVAVRLLHALHEGYLHGRVAASPQPGVAYEGLGVAGSLGLLLDSHGRAVLMVRALGALHLVAFAAMVVALAAALVPGHMWSSLTKLPVGLDAE